MRFVLAVLVGLLAIPATAQKRSGYDDAGPQVRAMQDDDTANPGFLRVQQGEALWNQAAGTAGKSCATCHADAASMRGVATRYPAFDATAGRPLTLSQRICSATIWVKAGDNLDECPDRAVGGIIVAVGRVCNA